MGSAEDHAASKVQSMKRGNDARKLLAPQRTPTHYSANERKSRRHEANNGQQLAVYPSRLAVLVLALSAERATSMSAMHGIGPPAPSPPHNLSALLLPRSTHACFFFALHSHRGAPIRRHSTPTGGRAG